jgi:hypothetical protein
MAPLSTGGEGTGICARWQAAPTANDNSKPNTIFV